MNFLDKILGKPGAEESLRRVARDANRILEELGLEHKEVDEAKQVELPEVDAIAGAIAEAMIDALGEDAPENAMEIATAAAERVIAMIEAVMPVMDEEEMQEEDEEVPMVEENAAEDKELREKVLAALEQTLDENDALSKMLVDDLPAIQEVGEQNGKAVTELAKNVKELTAVIDALKTEIKVVKRQLTRVGKRASEAVETEVDAADVPEEVKAVEYEEGTSVTGPLKPPIDYGA